MFHGGKLVLLVVSAALIAAGCQSTTTSSSRPSESPTTTVPQSPEPAPQPPADASTHQLAIPAPAKTDRGLVAELKPTRTPKFSMVGVTWDRTANDGDVSVEVRVRKDDGWSAWEALEVDHDGGEAGRGGTEPWWIEDADEVSARVTTAGEAAPTGVKVVTVDPGESEDAPATASPAFYSSDMASTVTSIADGRPAYTGQPRIISRAQWSSRGADGCGQDGYSVYGPSTQGVNIHHTAGTNSYTASQSYAIVRATQRFHMDGRGWCDIAYNFLVDKYGQIFEGRAGGINRAVRGSHSGNNTVNEMTMGVALMGNLDKAKPSTSMKNSSVKLIGWRIGTSYLPAKGTVKIGSKTLNRISGHRNVVSTACPGKYGYAWLGAKGGLRDRVAAYVSGYTSAIKTAQSRVAPSTKGAVVIGEYGVRTRVTVFSKLDYYWARSFGAVAVIGGFRTTFNKAGATAGGLGWPAAGIVLGADAAVDRQQFQFGAVYGELNGASHAVWGPIYDAYQTSADVAGPLGAPTSGIVQTGDVKRVTFEHGSITQTGAAAPVIQLDGAPAEKVPPTEPTEPAQPSEPTPTPTPSDAASDEATEPVVQTFPVLWLRRSGMIAA